MAVKIDGVGVHSPGAENYSVVEDSTPINPADTSGGYGQITAGYPEKTDSRAGIDWMLVVEDPSKGSTTGIIRTLSETNGNVTATADSRMALLAATKSADPFVGTLLGAFEYYLGLVGITDGYVVEDSLQLIPVTLRGWRNEVGVELTDLAMAHGAELSLVSSNIVMRPVRGRIAQNYRDASRTWNVDSSQVAQTVVVNYYPTEEITGGLVYPPGGWNPDVEIYHVDANETQVFKLDISSSLTAIEQPVATDYVASEYEASSVYAIAGQDGLPYPAAQWLAMGGSMLVEVDNDNEQLVVTVVGANDPTNAPFGIKMSAGDSSFYSSLRLVGDGVRYEKKSVTLHTGADPERATQPIGVTVDKKTIQTLEQAYSMGAWAAGAYADARYTIHVESSGINRRGDSGSYIYPTFEDFNALYAGLTFDDFNALWPTETFADFNAYMRTLVEGDFANQAFGNVAGARVYEFYTYFRVRSATITPGGVVYDAERDTTFDDFNTAWGPTATFTDFNNAFLSQTFRDFNLRPLATELIL